jgi:hypothetical protein
MKLSEFWGKFFINLYPPFLFNRVRILEFGKNYQSCKVKIKKSFWNRNMNGTIFGGSLFSASDPFYAILYWQVFERKGLRVQTWLKSARIQYLKPAKEDLYLQFNLSDDEINEAYQSLMNIGKFKKVHEVRYYDKQSELYVIAETEVYIRLVKESQKPLSGF